MEKDILVSANGVSKKFCKDFKLSMRYAINDIFSEVLGKNEKIELRKSEFWAVKDISFELRRGECLGLIGHNGAGKSTLLKMLNGLIKPDMGTITMRGRVSALIELGAGFDPVLTGRENIYVNGSVLGFSKKEIDEKFNAIVEFSEIGEYINTPVQNYSSGMKARLGFAVASNMDPDILIIDEVLAVGDAGFRIKCLNAISKLLKKCAVILVSHSMPMIGRISSHILLMEKGKEDYYGLDVPLGMQKYYGKFNGESGIKGGKEILTLKSLQLSKINEKEKIAIDNIKYGDDAEFDIEFECIDTCPNFFINVEFIDKDMKVIASCNSQNTDSYFIYTQNQSSKISLRLNSFCFAVGQYTISIYCTELRENKTNGDVIYFNTNAFSFSVSGTLASNSPIQLMGKWNS
jgi:lipopolysaccharide transport system ATP-binding protein